MYLEEHAIRQLLQTLRRLFRQHKLICDLMTRDFFENYGKTMLEKITGIGTSFKFTVDDPAAVFLEQGYQLTEEVPIIEKSVLFEAPEIPESVLESIRTTLPKGYSIYVFETSKR